MAAKIDNIIHTSRQTIWQFVSFSAVMAAVLIGISIGDAQHRGCNDKGFSQPFTQ